MDKQAVMEEKTYRLSRAGRRMAYLLLAGGVLIWLFALWTLKNTLRIGVRNFLPSVESLFNRIVGTEGAMPAEEAIPAVVMLVLAIIVPLLIWNIIEEIGSSFTVGPAEITFRSWGIELSYPWKEVADLHPVDEEAEEPLDELILRTSRLSSIHNPIARFLHWQAYGRRKLPLYGGLEDRDDLVARIRAHMAWTKGAEEVAVEETEALEARVEETAAEEVEVEESETVEAGVEESKAVEAAVEESEAAEAKVDEATAEGPLTEAGEGQDTL